MDGLVNAEKRWINRSTAPNAVEIIARVQRALRRKSNKCKKVAFNDLEAQYAHLKEEIDAGIASVIKGCHLSLDPRWENWNKRSVLIRDGNTV